MEAPRLCEGPGAVEVSSDLEHVYVLPMFAARLTLCFEHISRALTAHRRTEVTQRAAKSSYRNTTSRFFVLKDSRISAHLGSQPRSSHTPTVTHPKVVHTCLCGWLSFS